MGRLDEGLQDRGAAVATLAIPIRPLIRIGHARADGLGLVSSQQLHIHWVRPPKLGIETRWGCARTGPGRGRGPEVEPHCSRKVGRAVAAVVLSHEAGGVAADFDGIAKCFPGQIAGQGLVGRGEERGIDTGLERERGYVARRSRRH